MRKLGIAIVLTFCIFTSSTSIHSIQRGTSNQNIQLRDGKIIKAVISPEISCSTGNNSATDCYAVCTYKGGSGAKYIGISSDGCNSACDEAEKKCTDANDGPCEKVKCTATDCGL